MLRSEAQYAALPKLPNLPAKEMAGPTPWCNWVRALQIMCLGRTLG